MGNYFTRVMGLTLAVLITGCAGGKRDVPVTEAPDLEVDSTKSFVFVETPFLTIDSDMMADQFGAIRRPEGAVTLDSAFAEAAVYEILLDSLLGREADTFDLATEEPNLFRQYRQMRYDKVMRLMYKEVIVDSVSVSDSAVRVSYAERQEEFKRPDQYRARHIVIAGEGLRQGEDSLMYTEFSDDELDSIARAMATDLRERILGGENFDTLAIMYSQDERSARMGGDLGYFELDQMVSPFDSAVEHTSVGDLSGIIKTKYGWHIVKVEDFSPTHYLPIDSVYALVENKLMEQAVMERSRWFMDSLRREAVIVFDTAVLLLDDSVLTNDMPMAYVNPDDRKYGNDTLYYIDYREHEYSYKKFKQIETQLPFEERVKLLEGVALRPLLSRAARKLGYFDRAEVEEWAKETVARYSISMLRKRLMNDDYEPTDEELKAYYDAHIEDYVVERPFTVQHIIFSDSSLAEHVRDLLMSGYDFMEMVDQYYPGDPDIRRAAADLGEIGLNDMPPEFMAAARLTPVGGISHPVKTEYGYHLVKVLRKTYNISLEQATAKIRPILIRQHKDRIRGEYVESKLGGPPTIYWEYLDRLYFNEPTKADYSRMRLTP